MSAVTEFKDYSAMARGELNQLALMGRPLATLADVIRWGLSRSPERTVVDVVVQDEYTHDVVMDWDDGRYLVFDTT